MGDKWGPKFAFLSFNFCKGFKVCNRYKLAKGNTPPYPTYSQQDFIGDVKYKLKISVVFFVSNAEQVLVNLKKQIPKILVFWIKKGPKLHECLEKFTIYLMK